jgi:hypothetical protein
MSSLQYRSHFFDRLQILQALGRLKEAEVAAARGQHQFLSGLLHNLAKVLTSDIPHPNPDLQLRAVGVSPGDHPPSRL